MNLKFEIVTEVDFSGLDYYAQHGQLVSLYEAAAWHEVDIDEDDGVAFLRAMNDVQKGQYLKISAA